MYCDLDNDAVTCPLCRRAAKKRNLRRHCLAAGPNRPTFMQQAGSFVSAQAQWIAAGRPARSGDEIARIFQTLCRPCEHFQPHAAQPERGHCKRCGCGLRKTGGVLNKIKMATESCPLGKW